MRSGSLTPILHMILTEILILMKEIGFKTGMD